MLRPINVRRFGVWISVGLRLLYVGTAKYVQLKVQLDVLFVFFIAVYFLALHVSGAIAPILRKMGAIAPETCRAKK
jgi:hypothetical protein